MPKPFIDKKNARVYKLQNTEFLGAGAAEGGEQANQWEEVAPPNMDLEEAAARDIPEFDLNAPKNDDIFGSDDDFELPEGMEVEMDSADEDEVGALQDELEEQFGDMDVGEDGHEAHGVRFEGEDDDFSIGSEFGEYFDGTSDDEEVSEAGFDIDEVADDLVAGYTADRNDRVELGRVAAAIRMGPEELAKTKQLIDADRDTFVPVTITTGLREDVDDKAYDGTGEHRPRIIGPDGSHKIAIGKKGLPLGIIERKHEQPEVEKGTKEDRGVGRRKDETPEERKARKAAIKEEARKIREGKKKAAKVLKAKHDKKKVSRQGNVMMPQGRTVY